MLSLVLAVIIPLIAAFAPTGSGTRCFIEGSVDQSSSAVFFLHTVGALMCSRSDER